MIPAATYVRASTEHQRYSTSNQMAALEMYASTNGYRVLRNYADDGRSGLTIKGRPGLRALISQVMEPSCPFKALLVYDVSRWGRFQDPDESAYYEFMCRSAGVAVIYCAESFGNDGTLEANLLKALKRSMAAEYSRELSVKVCVAKRRLAALGFTLHDACYGLRRGLVDDDGRLKFVLERGQRKSIHTDRIVLVPGPPGEVAAIRLVFRLFLKKQLGYRPIARELNRRDIPSPAGGEWNGSTVRHILRKEAYVGDLVYGRVCRQLKGTPHPAPPETWIKVRDAHQGLISRRTFAAARRRMEQISSRQHAPEDFLPKLKALFEQQGYLTPSLINAQPHMPTAAAYAGRYRGLINAYRAVGYISPRDGSEDWDYVRVGQPTRQELLQRLKALLDREGRLTTKLIEADPATPSFHVYQWAFGSLYAAYLLIGYWPVAAGSRQPRTRASAEACR